MERIPWFGTLYSQLKKKIAVLKIKPKYNYPYLQGATNIVFKNWILTWLVYEGKCTREWDVPANITGVTKLLVRKLPRWEIIAVPFNLI